MCSRRLYRGTIALALTFIFSTGFTSTAADEIVPVPQGWSPNEKNNWYTRSQGSRLLPRAWLIALEQPDSNGLFLERTHIEKFRYLPNSLPGTGQLPIGFAIDTQNDSNFSEITKLRWKSQQSATEPWVGMNCAACHTAEITFQEKRFRIDGAPALADFQGFMKALSRALVATRDNPEKWNRFAAAVFKVDDKPVDNPKNRNMLKSELAKLIDWQLKVERANQTDLDYGFARLDAFGHIFNKVRLRANTSEQFNNPSDAPVSYPFLWNIHQHDKVQWNGIAPNVPLSRTFDIGALGRNVGEVTGVFADLKLEKFGPAIRGYNTSANVRNLVQLEQQIAKLMPPVWPSVFPAIDAEKWEVGKTIFNEEPGGCNSCHQVLRRDDLETRFEVEMTRLIGDNAIGTDPWMACNVYTYQARAGLLKFTPKKFFVGTLPILGEKALLSDMLGTAVIGSIWNKGLDLKDVAKLSDEDLKQTLKSSNPFALKRNAVRYGALIAELFQPTFDVDKAARLKRCMNEENQFLAYKGRPLTGIWATPPYLHNGSVPTLYDLLLPPNQRPDKFPLGTREFDPQKVGYVTDQTTAEYLTERSKQENTFVFRTRDPAGNNIAGNSNAGHNYGNALTEVQRWALVEYMKAVGGRRDGNKIVP